MMSEFNDIVLWERLKNYTINNTRGGMVNNSHITTIYASRSMDKAWDFKDLKEFGCDLYIVCIDGETNYVSKGLYTIVEEKLLGVHNEYVPKEKPEVKKTTRRKGTQLLE